MKFLKYFFALSLFTGITIAQEDSVDVESANENILEESIEEVEDSDLIDLLEELEDDPVNINKASISEMLVIPFMDLNSAELIYNYRNATGGFFSLTELNNVKGLSRDIINKCIPFLCVTDRIIEDKRIKSSRKDYSLNLRTRYFNTLSSNNEKYIGTAYKSYSRLKTSYKNFMFGLLSEKDAGESNITDFISYYAGLKNYGVINNLVLGNYLIEFGQGLSLWRPYGLSKGAEIIFPAAKKDKRIIPYTSTDENNFFRGAAADIYLGNFKLLAFYSNNSIDANIDSTNGIIKSLGIDGYHRTKNEISKKNSLIETSYGGRIDYSYKDIIRVGFLSHVHSFDHQFGIISLSKPSGQYFFLNSVAYNINLEGIYISGETAQSGRNIASINSLQFSPLNNFDIILSARIYPTHYISFHAFAFGENSGAPQNETGYYSGLRYKSAYGVISLYYDQFKFPAASFLNSFPLKGNEFYLNYSVQLFKYFTFNARYKNELKEISIQKTDKHISAERIIKSYRTEIIYNVFRNLRLKGRFDFQEYYIPTITSFESGYSIFQDIYFNLSERLNISSRIIFFKTDSYNSRIYEYENDLDGVMYNPALYKNGYRFYFLFKYKILDYLKLSIKYSETNKPSEKIAIGNYYKTGLLDNRVSMQLEVIL